eukprot:TRINITY_DN12920_c0_g1_i3.p1 TRINITY_DN12920_c0_g1~~TRINITY_DN12920_c0_g1_i3.p1  ORF type:complete len:651 (-),score=176.54 TRINITY_DN12920_c0_g1_i3:485-2437(-)
MEADSHRLDSVEGTPPQAAPSSLLGPLLAPDTSFLIAELRQKQAKAAQLRQKFKLECSEASGAVDAALKAGRKRVSREPEEEARDQTAHEVKREAEEAAAAAAGEAVMDLEEEPCDVDALRVEIQQLRTQNQQQLQHLSKIGSGSELLATQSASARKKFQEVTSEFEAQIAELSELLSIHAQATSEAEAAEQEAYAQVAALTAKLQSAGPGAGAELGWEFQQAEDLMVEQAAQLRELVEVSESSDQLSAAAIEALEVDNSKLRSQVALQEAGATQYSADRCRELEILRSELESELELRRQSTEQSSAIAEELVRLHAELDQEVKLRKEAEALELERSQERRKGLEAVRSELDQEVKLREEAEALALEESQRILKEVERLRCQLDEEAQNRAEAEAVASELRDDAERLRSELSRAIALGEQAQTALPGLDRGVDDGQPLEEQCGGNQDQSELHAIIFTLESEASVMRDHIKSCRCGAQDDLQQGTNEDVVVGQVEEGLGIRWHHLRGLRIAFMTLQLKQAKHKHDVRLVRGARTKPSFFRLRWHAMLATWSKLQVTECVHKFQQRERSNAFKAWRLGSLSQGKLSTEIGLCVVKFYEGRGLSSAFSKLQRAAHRAKENPNKMISTPSVDPSTNGRVTPVVVSPTSVLSVEM